MKVFTGMDWNEVLYAEVVEPEFRSSDRSSKYMELREWTASIKQCILKCITDETKWRIGSQRPEYCLNMICRAMKTYFEHCGFGKLEWHSGVKERFAMYYAIWRYYMRYLKELHYKCYVKHELKDQYASTHGQERRTCCAEIVNTMDILKMEMDL